MWNWIYRFSFTQIMMFVFHGLQSAFLVFELDFGTKPSTSHQNEAGLRRAKLRIFFPKQVFYLGVDII